MEKKIASLFPKEYKITADLIEKPKDFGDYSLPCFSLAKNLKKDPKKIAEELAKKIKKPNYIKEIKVIGAYINFFLDKADMANDILTEVLQKKEKYGSSGIGKGKKALIEHTSINPNASPHVGRARNAIIGDCLYRVLKFQGYKAESHYLVNDVGKQIAMLVLGCEGKKKITFDSLLDVYVNINKRVEANEDLEKEIFELLNKLENGDKVVKKKFRDVVKICIDGQAELFKQLDIHYDYFDYESEYLWKKETNQLLEALKKTGKVFVDDDKRNVLDLKGFNLSMKVPVFVLTRGDGTSLYGLRDLAYTADKVKKAEKNIVVLGEDHKLYFQQLKAALSLIKMKFPEVVHYSFILLKEGKMSTRKGTLILLEHFMKRALIKAEDEILQRHGKIANLKKLAKTIGYGAVKYSILKVSSEKNVTFQWEHALNFDGESAPYIQYSHARICSLLEKAEKLPKKADFSLLKEQEETLLIKKIAEFKDVITKVSEDHKPHTLAIYLNELAKSYNEFYQKHQILKAESKLRDARLLLSEAARIVLQNSLYLTGLEAPQRM